MSGKVIWTDGESELRERHNGGLLVIGPQVWTGASHAVRLSPSTIRAMAAALDAEVAALCGGCNVRRPFEHRCHGGGCPCAECKPPTPEELAEFLPALDAEGKPDPSEKCAGCGEERRHHYGSGICQDNNGHFTTKADRVAQIRSEADKKIAKVLDAEGKRETGEGLTFFARLVIEAEEKHETGPPCDNCGQSRSEHGVPRTDDAMGPRGGSCPPAPSPSPTAQLTAERDRYHAAIEWALGGTPKQGEPFRERRDGEGPYWWRTELSHRARFSDEERDRFTEPAKPSPTAALVEALKRAVAAVDETEAALVAVWGTKAVASEYAAGHGRSRAWVEDARAALEYVEAADRADAIRNRIGFHAPTPHEADEHIAAIEGAAQASKKLWKAVRDRLATPSDKAADAARKG